MVETIDQRRAKDDKWRARYLGGARRFRYNLWHEDDDKEQVERLQKRIELAIRSFHIGSEVHEAGALERIENEVKVIAARQAQELRAMGVLQTQEREAIAGRQTQEREAIAARQTRESESMAARQTQEREAIATRQTEEMRTIAAFQAQSIRRLQTHQELAIIKQELKPVQGSRYCEEGMPNGCLPHTRVKLMEQLRSWATDNSESCPPIFGLSGLAGTGKTPIAISFCEVFELELPVISFFISRTSAERRIPKNIIHTIAYQLGHQQVAARTDICDALQNG